MSLGININEVVKVQLTDLGKNIYYHQFDEFNCNHGYNLIKPKFPEVDDDGYTKFQLWKLMKLYGQYFTMGKSELPFMNILIEQKE